MDYDSITAVALDLSYAVSTENFIQEQQSYECGRSQLLLSYISGFIKIVRTSHLPLARSQWANGDT